MLVVEEKQTQSLGTGETSVCLLGCEYLASPEQLLKFISLLSVSSG